MNWSLVTGATGGLGAAVATRLASEGRSLIVSGRDANRLESIANDLRETHGVDVRTVPADLATNEGLDALRSITDPLDLVVVCGAAYHYGSLMELGDAEFERLTVCNVQNTGRLIRWAIEPLERTNGGLLVVGSMGAILPAPQHASYSASKAWLHQFVRSIQSEEGSDAVRITLGIPGGMATPMLLDSPAWESMQNNPLARMTLMSPEFVATQFLAAVRRGRPVVIPGFLNRWACRLVRGLPLWLRLWVARRFYAVGQ
ncbi:MAG: hypothetical protein CL930_10325 [Deltaproteobacteria bacterium]|nr:hypothetical protein [Deltaproteobacteria bacterium]